MATSTPIQRPASPPPARPPRRKAPARRPPPEGFLERLALFAATFAPERAARLLEQLGAGVRDEALQHSRRIAALDPASRQGRVVRVFGERPEAGERLRALMAEAKPGFARLLWERLPPHHRTLFPELARLAPSGPPPPPAQVALAARLVKEATR